MAFATTTFLSVRSLATALIFALFLPACLLCSEDNPDLCLERFNECDQDKGQKLGVTLVDLDLRQRYVWTGEAAVGNFVADAIYAIAQQGCGAADKPCPVAAFENAGAIRYETTCGEREMIPRGPVYESDIRQMLPFASNRIDVLELTGHDLKLALEHSVDLLGQHRTSEQGGHFLQVSRLRFQVDCSQPAQTRDSTARTILEPGTRIVEDSLMIRTDDGGPYDTPTWENVVTDDTHLYHVATNSFIGAGLDGYVAFAMRESVSEGERAIDGDSAFCDGSFLCKNIYYLQAPDGSYFSDASSVSSYLRQEQEIAPHIDGRIQLYPNCYIGSQD